MHKGDSIQEKSEPYTANRLNVWSFYCLLLAAVIAYTCSTVAEPDIWGHVKFGLDILQWHSLPQYDPYSYITSGIRWINDEWLSEIILANAYLALSSLGLTILHIGLVTILFAIIFTRFARERVPAILALFAGAMTLLNACYCGGGLMQLRAQLFTFLFLALQLILMQDSENTHRTKKLFFLPLLFLFWINMHGAVLLGLLLLYTWTIARLIQAALKHDTQRANIAWLVVATLSTVATLITPYGADLLFFLVKAGTEPRPEITEFHPLHFFSNEGFIYFILCLIAGWALHKRMFKHEPIAAVILLMTMLLPFKAVRHLPLAAIPIAILCAGSFRPSLRQHPHILSLLDLQSLSYGARRILALVSIGAAFLLILMVSPYMTFIPVGPTVVPVRAVYLLKESGISGNIACWFNWGEYCIWHLYPRIKVSFDGRRETVYTKPKSSENLRFIYGLKTWDDLLTQEKTTIVLTTPLEPTFALMRLKSDWKLVYFDGEAAIFLPKGSPNIARLTAVAAAAVSVPAPAKLNSISVFP